MRTNLLAALGLGFVAAVVLASTTRGPLFVGFLLFFITPLPIALAGLGWGWLTGVLAGAVSVGLIAVLMQPAVAAAFAATQIGPMVLLTYLTCLSRPAPLPPPYAGADEAVPLEWYPPGRLVVWAAVISAFVSLATLTAIGGDLETLRTNVSAFIAQTIKSGLPEGELQPLSETDIARVTDVAMSLLPAAAAIIWMGSLLFNLWLAGRVTLASGQLPRPWPDLGAMVFPRGTGLILALALFGTALSGYGELTATSIAGPFFFAYVLMGLAIIHYTTRNRSWRPFALWAVYAVLLLVNFWFAVVIALVGLSDVFLNLRARYAPPPEPPT